MLETRQLAVLDAAARRILRSYKRADLAAHADAMIATVRRRAGWLGPGRLREVGR